MTVESEIAGPETTAPPVAAEPPAAPAANPALLGLITFLPSGITLGLWFVGYLDTTALPGGMIAVAVFAAGLFQLISAVWAGRIGASSVAAIFGVFSAFWITFGVQLFFLNNGHIVDSGTGQPIVTAQVDNILETYLLSFLIVFIILTLATLRLPLMFTAGFVFVTATFALAFLAVTLGATGLFPIAGITTFIFCAIFAYILFDGFSQDLGGTAMAMGNPLRR